MNFATLKGLTIPEGVVTQITDAQGRVIWAVQSGGKPVILEVEKITSDTYAGETTYTGEEFILLDIYPKTNGTVKVTYGGLTKTITDTSGAAEPNAQQVFFGTFNGVSDEVETPASGELVIEGDYRAFAIGEFKASKYVNPYYTGITAVRNLGTIEYIPDYAFGNLLYSCQKITSVNIPASVKSIGDYAFYGCTGLTSVNIHNGVTNIGRHAFSGCTGLTSVNIPASVTNIGDNPWAECFENNAITVDGGNASYKIDGNCLVEIETNTVVSGFADGVIPPYVTNIGGYAFHNCEGLTSVNIPNGVTTVEPYAFNSCEGLTSVNIPASVTTIEPYAFNSCTGLTSVNLTEGLETIGNQAFYVCTGLTSITIPASVASIGTGAFHLQSGYTRTVTMLASTPPNLAAANAFNVIGTHNFIVPSGCGDTYKTAKYWSSHADYITEAA